MDERYAFSLLDAYCWKFARLFLLFSYYYTVFLYHSVCICGTRIRLISMNKSVTINKVCFFCWFGSCNHVFEYVLEYVIMCAFHALRRSD
jgi:hypothetical protein